MCSQAIVHNTIGGKYNRGMTVPDAYKVLKNLDELSPEQYTQTAVLGWCIELVRLLWQSAGATLLRTGGC